MSRLLYRLSYTATVRTCPDAASRVRARAPLRNRTVDLLLTMETLCRLSYWGQRSASVHGVTGTAKSATTRPGAAREAGGGHPPNAALRHPDDQPGPLLPGGPRPVPRPRHSRRSRGAGSAALQPDEHAVREGVIAVQMRARAQVQQRDPLGDDAESWRAPRTSWTDSIPAANPASLAFSCRTRRSPTPWRTGPAWRPCAPWHPQVALLGVRRLIIRRRRPAARAAGCAAPGA